MSDNNSGGGGGCFVVPLVAWTLLIGGVLYFGYGWESEEAVRAGFKWALGLVCGLPLVLIVGLVLLVIFAKVGNEWTRWSNRRARKRWDDIE